MIPRVSDRSDCYRWRPVFIEADGTRTSRLHVDPRDLDHPVYSEPVGSHIAYDPTLPIVESPALHTPMRHYKRRGRLSDGSPVFTAEGWDVDTIVIEWQTPATDPNSWGAAVHDKMNRELDEAVAAKWPQGAIELERHSDRYDHELVGPRKILARVVAFKQ